MCRERRCDCRWIVSWMLMDDDEHSSNRHNVFSGVVHGRSWVSMDVVHEMLKKKLGTTTLACTSRRWSKNTYFCINRKYAKNICLSTFSVGCGNNSSNDDILPPIVSWGQCVRVHSDTYACAWLGGSTAVLRFRGILSRAKGLQMIDPGADTATALELSSQPASAALYRCERNGHWNNSWLWLLKYRKINVSFTLRECCGAIYCITRKYTNGYTKIPEPLQHNIWTSCWFQ